MGPRWPPEWHRMHCNAVPWNSPSLRRTPGAPWRSDRAKVPSPAHSSHGSAGIRRFPAAALMHKNGHELLLTDSDFL